MSGRSIAGIRSTEMALLCAVQYCDTALLRLLPCYGVPIFSRRMLRARYGMSGTEVGYAALR
eukprot:2695765-Rhodomonas_salina.1